MCQRLFIAVLLSVSVGCVSATTSPKVNDCEEAVGLPLLYSAADRVIVGYRANTDPAEVEKVVRQTIADEIAAMSSRLNAHLDDAGFTITQLPAGYNGFVVDLTREMAKARRCLAGGIVNALRSRKDIIRYAEVDHFEFAQEVASHENSVSAVGVIANRCSTHSTAEGNVCALDLLSAPAAWTTVPSAKDTKIAIVDSGVALHDDLDPRSASDVTDDMGHGTYLAGVVAALHDGYGMRGIAPGVQAIGFKFLDSRGRGDAAKFPAIVEKAVSLGANVILLSWGSSVNLQVIADAIDLHKNVLFVAPAGNSGSDVASAPVYPAAYSKGRGNVISVLAVDCHGNVATFSNFGKDTVDIAAPGDGPGDDRTCSTVLNQYYGRLNGTSVAAAYVAGAAALVMERKGWYPNPTEDNINQTKNILKAAVPAGAPGNLKAYCVSGDVLDVSVAVK